MKTITVMIADKVYELALEEALERSTDIGSLGGAIFSDYFLGEGGASPASISPNKPSPRESRASEIVFDPSLQLSEFPLQSVRLARQFIDEALKLPGVKAFKDKRGVGFDPNFVFIEYIMTRRTGIAVSFYGTPKDHKNPHINKGRGPSYSRARVYSQEELISILPHVRKAYELKFGKV